MVEGILPDDKSGDGNVGPGAHRVDNLGAIADGGCNGLRIVAVIVVNSNR